ncbi:MAG: hypothetical protein U0169_27220 [Polyangiaceae bacterium]
MSDAPRRRPLGGFAVVAFGTVALVVTASVRTARDGERALEASRAAFAAGDFAGAIRTAREAAECRVPFTRHADLALDQLGVVAESAELRGEVRTATAAWQAMRSAALATPSPWTPWSAWNPRNAFVDRASNGLVRVAGRAEDDARKATEVHVTGDALRASLTRRGLPPAWSAPLAALAVVLAAVGLSSRLFAAVARGFSARAIPARLGLLGAASALAAVLYALA